MNYSIWYKVKLLLPGFMRDKLIDLVYYSRSFFYKGDSVFCPVCQRSFSSFYKGEIGPCPRCGAGSRHRLFFLFLIRKTNFFKDQLKVLHFAPEHCFYRKLNKLSNLNYLSADLNSPRAMQKVDMTNMSFPDNSFDVLFSNHVLEHVPDDRKAMKELYRIQNLKGWSIHLVPIDYDREQTFEDSSINTDELRLKNYGHHDHKRIYGRDYMNRLKEAGFKVDLIDFSAEINNEDRKKYGLRSRGIIYYCTK